MYALACTVFSAKKTYGSKACLNRLELIWELFIMCLARDVFVVVDDDDEDDDDDDGVVVVVVVGL